MTITHKTLSRHVSETLEQVANEEMLKNYKIYLTEGKAKGENYLGEIIKIIIEGLKNGRAIKLNLVVKEALTDQFTRIHMKMNSLYRRESYFYTEFLPLLYRLQSEGGLTSEERFSYAKLYKSIVEDNEETLVFGDLTVEGFEAYDRHLPYDRDHLKLTVKNLAKYHAANIVLKDRHPDKYKEAAAQSANMKKDFSVIFTAVVEKSKKMAIELCRGETYGLRFAEFAENMYDVIMKCWSSETAEPYNVICHGDCWSTNFLFKYENGKLIDTILVDWQLAREASPVTDLAYLIFLSTDKQLRSNHYKDTLRMYYATLKHNVTKMGTDISKFYPESVFWDHVGSIMKCGLAVAVYGLSFVLGNKGEAIDMNSLLTDAQNGGMESIPTNERYLKRLKDIIEDCSEYGFF